MTDRSSTPGCEEAAVRLARFILMSHQSGDRYESDAMLTIAKALIARSEIASSEPVLWLWKNFVDGRPEYWAFDNPYPCHPNGDPITLGEPCGYAIVKPSKRGRKDVSDEQVIEAIKRAKP